jgi:NADH:ubiquinone oxidoreductase subunit 4 (subunit M)
MLRAARRILHGEMSSRWADVADATFWRRTPFVLLLAALLLFGIWPAPLTEKIKPSADIVVRLATGQTDKKRPARKLVTESQPGVPPRPGGTI